MPVVSLKESRHALREFCADAQQKVSTQPLDRHCLSGRTSLGASVAVQNGEVLHIALQKWGLRLHHWDESGPWTAMWLSIEMFQLQIKKFINNLGISKTHQENMVLTEADFLAEVQYLIKKIGLKIYKQSFINDPTVLNSFKKTCLNDM